MFRESWIFYKLRKKSIIGRTDFQTSYSVEKNDQFWLGNQKHFLSEYSRTG